jgi:lactoylglutathione lyase
MVRISNIEQSLAFYRGLLGLAAVRRIDNPIGRFTLIFLTAPGDRARAAVLPEAGKQGEMKAPLLELTYNYDPESYSSARNFGHLAFEVDDIYAVCDRLMKGGVVISRPPRDGRMAFVRSPDNISIELLQRGQSLPKAEPWTSMANTGTW